MTTHGLRWSSARDCPRKAVYEATGAPHRERTHREDRTLWRGRAVGHEYVIALAHEQRTRVHVCSGPDYVQPWPAIHAADRDAAGILAELPVEWELGVGHADAFVVESQVVLEVVSSQNATGELIHSKLLQAAGYCRALDAAAVCVVVVDPVTLADDRVIVTRDSSKWDRLMGEVDERVATLLEWRETGRIPDRVCRKPADAWSHFCLYGGHCFDDVPEWTPDFNGELWSDEAQMIAIALERVKTQRREISKTDSLLEDEQKALQAQLAAFVPEGAWQVGGYLVKRQARTGRRSFDFARADLDGRFPDGLLAEFTKQSDGFEVWAVEKTGAVVTTDDEEGEVPF